MVRETPDCQVGDYVRIVDIPALHDIVGRVAAIDATGPVRFYAVAFSPFPNRYLVELIKRGLTAGSNPDGRRSDSPAPLATVHFFSRRNLELLKPSGDDAILHAPFTEKFVDPSGDGRPKVKAARGIG